MKNIVVKSLFFIWLLGLIYLTIYFNWFNPATKYQSFAYNMGFVFFWFLKGSLIKIVFKGLGVIVAILVVVGFIGYKLQNKSSTK